MSNRVIIDFSKRYCLSEVEILQSSPFKKVFEKYLNSLKNKNDDLVTDFLQNDSQYLKHLIEIFKLLIAFDYDEIIAFNPLYQKLLKNRTAFLKLVEDFYNYWRFLERYALVRNQNSNRGFQNVSFMEATNNFANLVLRLYRKIVEKIRGEKQNIYRQLPAGVNAGAIITSLKAKLPTAYAGLKAIPFFTEITLRPPFIVYPHKNTRSGVFKEISIDPRQFSQLDHHQFYAFPAKVGNYLALVYFHADFMHHGISLCNLFELATYQEVQEKNVDIICVFGVNDPELIGFTHDVENNLYLGVVGHNLEFDYFGYMKKMLLTLHNLKKIDEGSLPLHGAMAHVVLRNGTSKNIVLIGDSGAGKSETLAAFTKLSRDLIKEVKIIFDDMGSLSLNDQNLLAYGTETGAFVRLDDLELGYSYLQMDRAIYMNPDKINSRFIIPVSMYQDIIKGYPVDLLLYANNYQLNQEELTFFNTAQEAMDVFTLGRRQDKGTTSEKGIIDSYFANPFGPLQRQEVVDDLLKLYFNYFFEHHIPVGQIYTKLGLHDYTVKGPHDAAVALYNWLISDNSKKQ